MGARLVGTLTWCEVWSSLIDSWETCAFCKLWKILSPPSALIWWNFFFTLCNVLKFIEKYFFIFSSFVSPWLYYTLCKSPLTLMNNELVTYYGKSARDKYKLKRQYYQVRLGTIINNKNRNSLYHILYSTLYFTNHNLSGICLVFLINSQSLKWKKKKNHMTNCD